MRRICAAIVPCLLLLPACNTPKSICCDMVESIDAAYERCGIPLRIQLVKEDGRNATCDDVNGADNGEILLNECIPWAQNVDCDTLRADPENLDPSCDFMSLNYIE